MLAMDGETATVTEPVTVRDSGIETMRNSMINRDRDSARCIKCGIEADSGGCEE